jgi:drug/metabolite transporter (DMT)-like permease
VTGLRDAAPERVVHPPATMGVRLALLAMVTFFGGSLPAYKIASRSFGPATTNLGRFLLAATVLVIVARKRLGTARTQRKRLLLVGMFGLGLMAVFMGVGVDRGSATVSSIVVGLEPIGVALAGVLLVGDSPSRRSLVALAIGFSGALVASGILTEPSGEAPILPVVLLLGTVVTFSVYTAFVRRTARGVDPLAVAAVTQVGALAFVVPACLFDVVNGGMFRGNVQPKAAAAVVFLGVGSAVGYLLLCLVLSHQPASRVAVSMYLTPILGVVFSWLVASERLHLRDAVGGALVLLAVFISEWAPSRRGGLPGGSSPAPAPSYTGGGHPTP